MVMPSWQLESWVERDLRHLSRGSAAVSPVSTARCTVAWSKGDQGKFHRDKEAGAEDEQEACCEE